MSKNRDSRRPKPSRAATEAGRKSLISTVEKLTGQTVDHYAEIGLLGFVLLTDAVGGVDVCLNNEVHEPLSGANFRPGEQTLRGSQALSFVRQRHELPRGDLDRIVRQQVFMASLASKVLSQNTLSDPTKISLMRSAISRSVVLSDNWDVFSFAGKLAGIAGGDVSFQTIPVVDAAAETSDGESIVKVDPKDVEKMIDGFVESDDEKVDTNGDAITSVDIWNDTGIGGLATAVSAQLTGLGFHEGDVGNNKGPQFTKTTVLVNDRSSEVAQQVAKKLGGLPIQEDPEAPRQHRPRRAVRRLPWTRFGPLPRTVLRQAGLAGSREGQGSRGVRGRRDGRTEEGQCGAGRSTMRELNLTAAILDPILQRDPAGPRITHYDDATGARIELSGLTLMNWAAKTANFVRDEFALDPGARATILLPPHWQTAGVLLGVWWAGLDVSLDTDSECDVAFVTAADLDSVDAPEVVVLSLDAFGRPVPGLPIGVTDYATSVRVHGDRFSATAAGAALAGQDVATVLEPGAGKRCPAGHFHD